MTEQVGKPITQSREEIDSAIETAEKMMAIIDDALQEEIIEQTEYVTKKIVYEPRGIVLALLPTDFPIASMMNCVVPAILGGNAILLKDCHTIPFFSQIFEDAVEDIAPKVVQRFFMLS